MKLRVPRQATVCRLRNEDVLKKLGGALHQGIHRPEILFITTEKVFFPELLTEPRPSRGPLSPGAIDRSCCPPDVSVVMQHPSPCSIHHACGLLPDTASSLTICTSGSLISLRFVASEGQ